MKIPTSEKNMMLDQYYRDHNDQVSTKILKASFIYLFLSIVWNATFLLFELPYSRANIVLLLVCLGAWFMLVWGKRLFHISSNVFMHLVCFYLIFVVCCLYFGSGYNEAWAFFYLIPLVSGFYGDRFVLALYSVIGVITMLFLNFQFPTSSAPPDLIDLANRILLYAIIGTFSHLLLTQLNKLYNTQVNTIIEAADASIRQVVNTFIIAVEAKDAYTFGHSERVSKYAVELAKTISVYRDKKKMQTLYLSGLLHDIGKINIPEHVLTKNGALTTEEYELIKSHPVVGGNMVEKLPLLGSLKPGVLYHHERWDGQGYPSGIRGEKIPLDARILAVADVFDALTSNRSYRNAVPLEEAFKVLEEGSGTQFDPTLIAKLPDVKKAWLEIYHKSNNEIKEFEQLTDFL